MTERLTDNSQAILSLTTEQINGAISAQLNTLENYTTEIATDNLMAIFIKGNYSVKSPEFQIYQRYWDRKTAFIYRTLPDIDIHVYSNNLTLHSATAFLWPLPKNFPIDVVETRNYPAIYTDKLYERMQAAEKWIDVDRILKEGPYTGMWAICDFKNTGEDWLVCYRAVFSSLFSARPIGVVALGLPVEYVKRKVIDKAGDVTVQLYLNAERVFTLNAPEDLADLPSPAEDLKQANGSTSIEGNLFKRQFVNRFTSPNFIRGSSQDKWQLVVSVPYADLLRNIAFSIALVALAVLSFSVIIVITVLISRNIIFRSRVVIDHIDKIAVGNYAVSQALVGKDEFVDIQETLNMLSLRLKDFIEKNYKYEIALQDVEIRRQQHALAQKEAEIVALQNQINPHYFFNTLEAIRLHLYVSGDIENSDIIQFFAESLQTYAQSPHDRVQLREELEFLRNYVRLQNYRFNGTIVFKSDVPPDLLTVRIPCFMLQPIFENAIIHGFHNRFKKNLILLRVRRVGDELLICVLDNGNGMTREQLSHLQEHLQTGNVLYGGKSLALLNINRRLKLMFGRDCLSINSYLGRGTVVKVRLDINKLEGEEEREDDVREL